MYLVTIDMLDEGEVPKICRYQYLNAIARAHRLLDKVEVWDINKNLTTVDWMLFECAPERHEFSTRPSIAPKPEDLEFSTPQLLYRHRNEFALDAADSLTWPQYFGVLALHLCNKSCLMMMFAEQTDFPEERKALLPNTYAIHACEAVEAVCLGEAILEQEKFQATFGEHVAAKVREQRSLQASQAAIERHAEPNKIKNDFIDFYFRGSFPSRREAARRFYQNLPTEKQRTLSSTGSEENAVRTLTEALRTREKSPPVNS